MEDEKEEKIDTSSAVEEIKEMKQISNIFSGKMKQIVSYKLNGQDKENESESEFKTIYLDVGYKDLYSAWEEFFEDSLENYKPEGKEVVEAKSQSWIVELPKVLIFLVKRVAYDKEKKLYYKRNDPFDFEDVIYPDRYLIKNRAEADKLRSQVHKLREKATKLQEHIEKFKNYNGKKHELGGVLHSCVHLLKSNTEGMEAEDSKDGLTLFSPENLCKAVDPNSNDDKLNEIISFLTALQDKTKEQVESMEKQLADLQKEIKDYYKSVDKTPYHLHSLMIHDGNHESGHFYTFIKDFSKGVYRRYNDIGVSEVDEERVQLESKGGFGTINAYCLVYVSEETYKDCSKPNLHNYDLQYKDNKKLDEYNKLVPPVLAEKVYKENDALLQTITEAEASEMAKEIMSLYDQRMEKIKKFIQENEKNANLGYASSILQFFHKAKPDSPDNSHIGKWFLFDMCVKEKTGNEGGINAILDDDPLAVKLKSGFISANHKDAPRSLRLNDTDSVELMTKVSEFPETMRNVLVTCSVLNDIIEGNYKQAVLTIAKRKEELNHNLSGSAVFIRDTGKVMSLRFTSAINQAIIKGESYEQ
jgi:ubiquitin carboxyl-terminal hydrolase 25/28